MGQRRTIQFDLTRAPLITRMRGQPSTLCKKGAVVDKPPSRGVDCLDTLFVPQDERRPLASMHDAGLSE